MGNKTIDELVQLVSIATADKNIINDDDGAVGEKS